MELQCPHAFSRHQNTFCSPQAPKKCRWKNIQLQNILTGVGQGPTGWLTANPWNVSHRTPTSNGSYIERIYLTWTISLERSNSSYTKILVRYIEVLMRRKSWMVEHRTEDYALGFSKSPAVGINQRIDIHAVLITQMKLLPVDEIQQLSLTG